MRTTVAPESSGTAVRIVRIIIAALLLLAAFPLFYLGSYGVYAVFRLGEFNGIGLIPWTVAAALAVLNALGTLFSFRHVPLFLAALLAFYLGWAFSVYPYSGLLPFGFVWVAVAFVTLTGLNALWMLWTFRRLGLDLTAQLRIVSQALLFLVAFYVMFLGWANPYGPDNPLVASIFWVFAAAIAGLNLYWTIRSRHRSQPLRSL
jgi:hypothetical protein